MDEKVCNPLKVWHDLGEPAVPSTEELDAIKASARPEISTSRLPIKKNGAVLTITVRENGVVYFEAKASILQPDSGYNYDRVMQFKAPK